MLGGAYTAEDPTGGASGIQPDPGTPAPLPKFNPTTSLDLPPDWYSAREKIMSDPNLRMEFEWNQAKASQEAQKVDTKRYIDRSVLPIIEEDMRNNQAHIDYLHEQLDRFQQQQAAAPVPIRKLAQLDWRDSLGVLASALTGGNIGAAAGAAREYEQAANDNAYQNEVNKFNMEQHRADQIVAAARDELTRAEGRQTQLQGAQIGEISHQGDLAHADVQAAKNQFYKATNPGEVEAAAADWARLDPNSAPSTDAVEAAKRDAAVRYDKEQRSAAYQQYQTIVAQQALLGGSANPDQINQWQKQVDEINNTYGTHFAPLVGGESWRLQVAKMEDADKDARLAAEKAHWAKMDHSKDKQLANQMAQWSYERQHWERQDANAAARIVVQKELQGINDKQLEKLKAKRVEADAEYKAIQGQLTQLDQNTALKPSERRAQKTELFKKQSAAKLKLDSVDIMIKTVQDAQARDSVGAGLKYFGGIPYRQDPDGQWRPVK